MKLKAQSDIVYPYSSSAIYANQSGQFDASKVWETVVDGQSYTGAAEAFVEGKVSVADYFNGMLEFNKSKWNQKVY